MLASRHLIRSASLARSGAARVSVPPVLGSALNRHALSTARATATGISVASSRITGQLTPSTTIITPSIRVSLPTRSIHTVQSAPNASGLTASSGVLDEVSASASAIASAHTRQLAFNLLVLGHLSRTSNGLVGSSATARQDARRRRLGGSRLSARSYATTSGSASSEKPEATAQAATKSSSTSLDSSSSQSASASVSSSSSASGSASSSTASSSSQAAVAQSSDSKNPTELAKTSSSDKEVSGPKKPLTQRIWATVKKEAAHYWSGTKLLGKEIRISSKITWKVLNGGQLTRRERRQLRRTTTDLLRLIPFSVFVIVPFMEILLPVALKLFPNMLPSTFEGKLAADEKERKLLRVRIEMAKFLQETTSESGLKAEGVVNSQEFKEFFRKVRSTGESASPEDVIKVAKLFVDDITLDNLSRPQLVSMCKYMNINAFGTDNFLKHQIRSRLEKIRIDDMMIHAEGIESLSTKELKHACQSRGVRTSGVSPARLREELHQWIDLHYTNKVSGVLLVLSRAFHFEHTEESVFRSLEATLSSLPDNLLNEAELNVSGDTSTYKQKLEVLQQQQELIEDEAEQEQEEEEAREQAKRERKEKEERSKREEEARKARELLPENELSEQAAAEADKGKMTKEQLGELAEALSILSAKSSIVKERDELKQLMEDNISSEEESKLHPEETDSPQVSLNKRIRSMIKKIDSQLEEYDRRVGSSLNTIECNARGQISLEDLKNAMRVIKHRPDDETIEAVCKKLDVDQDGFVVLDHVVELTQDIGLGIVMDDDAQKILTKGAQIKEAKPKREDIVAD